MSPNTIGVFPASGGIGGSTLRNLLTRLPPKELVLVARYPQKLESAAAQGATVRKADYDDDQSLEHAFDGVDTLFLISYASVQHHHRTQRQKAAIDAAIRSGVRYIFYASLAYAGAPETKKSLAFVMQSHLDTELYLEECARDHGIGFTVVRQGLYTESAPLQLAFFDVKEPVDEIAIPHDGSGPGCSWVKQAELGEGNAELLRRFVTDRPNFPYEGKTVILTGPEELSYGQVVDILSRITGKQLEIKVIANEEWAAMQQIKDVLTYGNVDYALAMTSIFEAVRRGEAAVVSPLLGDLLGREPETFETTMSAMATSTSAGRTFWDK